MQKSGSLLFAARPGVTLVLVVMLLVLLQVAVMGTVTSSARQVDLMTVGYQGVQANYSAEGLLQRGIREAVRNTDEDGNGTIGTVGAAMGSSLTRTTSGSDSILTGTVAVGDVTRSLQYRWTVVQPVVASGMPLAEFFTVVNAPTALASIGWSGAAAAIGAVADINFDNSTSAMWRGGPTGRHGTRITGSLSITLPGTYTFNVESNDGSDFAINGSTLINNDGVHSMSGRSGTTVLAAGTFPFVARMFDQGNAHGFRLYWQPPGATALTLIPPSVMTGSGPSRGVTAHSWLSLRSNSQITAWARSGLAGGTAVVTNATTNNGSSAGIDLRNQALLLGDVQVGVGGALGTVLKLSGSSSWTGTGSALSVPAAVERVSMPVVPGTTLGSVVSLTNSATVSYGPGTVRCWSLSMAGDSVVTINGETVLIVDFTLSMANQARIQLAPGASLRLYVGSGVWMAGTAQINGTSSRSPDVRLYMTNLGTPTFAMGDSTLFCGNVQNPNGTIAMFSDSVFYGTMEANNVTLEQQARIFADVSASSGGSSIASATLVYFSDLTLPN